MKEKDIQKVLSGEVAVSELTDAEFNELIGDLKCMYCARVMNCVDGTGKSDKEWIALSNIFKRIATPRRNCDRFNSGDSRKDAADAWAAYEAWGDCFLEKDECIPLNEWGWIMSSPEETKKLTESKGE